MLTSSMLLCRCVLNCGGNIQRKNNNSNSNENKTEILNRIKTCIEPFCVSNGRSKFVWMLQFAIAYVSQSDFDLGEIQKCVTNEFCRQAGVHGGLTDMYRYI